MSSEDYFKMAYTVLGGLGIFFLGLRFLSESLQAMGSGIIRKLVSYATTNRIIAVFVGIIITAIVQSSSISTVMVVGLVNAGLMELRQAIGVIFGANIGTTVTGWILVVKIGKYGLLLIGLGIFPMLFSKRESVSAVGKTFLALGLIFFGLQLMSGAFKPLRTNEDFIGYLALFDTHTTFGLLGSVAIGCLLTFVIQSSSAMLGITIAMASTGTLSYPTAAALVLGENIGTTITALLASVGGNREATRASISHAIFNISGVALVLLFFEPYIQLVDSVVSGSPETLAADGSKPNIAAHIAMGHTLFNVTATLVMLPFLGLFANFILWLIPDKGKTSHRLRYLGTPGLVPSAVSLNMADLELKNMARMTKKILRRASRYVKAEKKDLRLSESVNNLEEITDNIQKEMTTFVCQVMEGSLNTEQSTSAYSMIRAADELESIADYAASLCKFKDRLKTENQNFSDQGWEDFFNLLERTRNFLSLSIKESFEEESFDTEKVLAAGNTLNELADSLRDAHLERMNNGTCGALPALIFSDMMVALRRIKNHTLNLYQALEFSNLNADSYNEEEH